MSLARSKRGLEYQTIIEILLVVVATGLVIGIFTAASSRADEKTSENLCRGLNALRFGTKVEQGPVSFNIAPRACKTIDKKQDIPSKDYKNHADGANEGAKTEIRDLMARCWWMWLEGNQKNIFNSRWYNLQNGCFICYTFSVDNGITPFTYDNFALSLSKPYYAVDDYDKCASAGQGGKCKPDCDGDSDYLTQEVDSTKCPERTKCCIAKDLRDECLNHGGRCTQTEIYSIPYSKWSCSSGRCYVKPDRMASYLDYFQGTSGVNSGAGKVLFFNDGGFQTGQKYAVTFVSPGNSFGWDNFAKGSGAAGIALGTSWLLTVVPTGVGNVVGIGGLALSSYLAIGAKNTGDINDINYILISKYDTVKQKCAVEAGVGEK